MNLFISHLRPGMKSSTFPEHVEIDSQVSSRGIETGVTKHLLNGAQVAPVLEQLCGHGGTQQVRVEALPWPIAADGVEAVIPAGEAESLLRILIDAVPDAPGAAKWLAAVGDKQGGGLTRAGLPANGDPAIQKPFQFLAERHKAVLSTLAVINSKNEIGLNGSELQFDELTGPGAGFIHQADHDVVTKAGDGGYIGRSKQLAHLPLCERPWQALRRPVRLRQVYGDISRRVVHQQRPAVERAHHRQFIIKGAGTDRATAISHPVINGGLAW